MEATDFSALQPTDITEASETLGALRRILASEVALARGEATASAGARAALRPIAKCAPPDPARGALGS